jgi:hypothetical protein
MKRAKSQRAQAKRIDRVIRDVMPRAMRAVLVRVMAEKFEREIVRERQRAGS